MEKMLLLSGRKNELEKVCEWLLKYAQNSEY